MGWDVRGNITVEVCADPEENGRSRGWCGRAECNGDREGGTGMGGDLRIAERGAGCCRRATIDRERERHPR